MSGVGAVNGIDRNDRMIVTARRVAQDIDWHIGQAGALPFDDIRFDPVINLFALMCFEDRPMGVAEMWLVTKLRGRLTTAVDLVAGESARVVN